MGWAEDRLLEEHHLLQDENAQTAAGAGGNRTVPRHPAAAEPGRDSDLRHRAFRGGRAGRYFRAAIAATSCSWCAAARCALNCPSAKGGIARWPILDAEIFLARWVSWMHARGPPLPWPPPRPICLCCGGAASMRSAGSARFERNRAGPDGGGAGHASAPHQRGTRRTCMTRDVLPGPGLPRVRYAASPKKSGQNSVL